MAIREAERMAGVANAAAADRTLTTEDWIVAARDMLIREGIDAVKVDRLAKECGVTRGGFYWRFKDRRDLLGDLLEFWKRTNTAPILATVGGPGTPIERFEALADLWIEEVDFNPGFDRAVRAWAAVAPDIADAVHVVDDQRVAAITDLFREAGYGEPEAFVRARIVYFHQVGYYAMNIRETPAERRALKSYYIQILAGLKTA
jgi:AcrR family transcriptional regulator